MQVVRSLSDDDRAAVRPLLDQLGDHLRLDVEHGPRDGFVAVVDRRGGEVTGYAQASTGNQGFVIGAAGEHRGELLRVLLDEVPGEVTWWTDDATLAAGLGLVPGRSLLQMTVPLPVESAAGVETRDFVPGRDEAAWLEVNNAAFGWHGEQGGWDLATLEQRMSEPWFRTDGFLLHERDGRLAAFCWTKLHPEAVGEIYVIAVHPDFHGLGLGRALTVAGLHRLHHHGARTGMLYVDAGNEPAVGLYRSLGFEVARRDQSFVRQGGTT